MNKNYYVIGDLHGSFKPVRAFYQRQPYTLQKQENILICLGDFGANYYLNERDRGFKHKLAKYPFTYFVIRGNHEERPSILAEKYPDKWERITEVSESFVGTYWVEKEFPHIHYAMDYPSMYKLSGYDTLVIPGAYSVDKFWRLQMDMKWFPNEQLTVKEMEDGWDLIHNIGNKVDLVLSHTCPCIYEPTDLFLDTVDQNTVDKSMERYLGKIEYCLNYKAWLWGHYHQFRNYPRTDGKYRTMLAWDEVINLDGYMNGIVSKL